MRQGLSSADRVRICIGCSCWLLLLFVHALHGVNGFISLESESTLTTHLIVIVRADRLLKGNDVKRVAVAAYTTQHGLAHLTVRHAGGRERHAIDVIVDIGRFQGTKP